jgi:hypothetical protein
MVLAWVINGFCALLLGWAAMYMLRRSRVRRKARQVTRELLVSPMSGLVMIGMLLGFQAIVQPQVRHRITEEQKEEAFEDEGEPTGGMLFHLQLRQIRKGEEVGNLTVKLDP